MKTCSTCGATYSNRIDFCFEDGAVLAVQQPADAPQPKSQEPDVTDAPQPPPRMVREADPVTSDTTSDDAAPTTDDAPPIKRRRSLLGATPAPVPQRATPLEPIAPPAEVAHVEYEEEVPTPEPRSAPRPPDPNRPASPTQDGTSEALPWFEPAANGEANAPPSPAGAGPSRPASSAADLARVSSARTSSLPPPTPLEVQKEEGGSRPAWLITAVAVGVLLLVVGGGFAAVMVLGIGGAALTGASTKEPPAPAPHAVAVPVASGVAAEVPVEALDTDVAMIPDTDAPAEEAEGTAAAEPEITPATAAPSAAVTPPPKAVAASTGTAAVVVAAAVTPPPAVEVGKVTFESTPPGATVTVDGASKGVAPVTVELPYGAHSVSFALAGHGSVDRSVDVNAATLSVPAKLVAEIKIGKVFVALPGRDGQTLFVDGRKIGPLPQSVDLTEGSHAFAVEAPDGTRVEVNRDVVFTDGRAFINL